jgi:hypothetical protein
MIEDPIVQEVHETRRRIFDECGGDLQRLIDRLKNAEAKDHDRLVTLEEIQKRATAQNAEAK